MGHVRRRRFLIIAGALLAAPLAAFAQRTLSGWRIGFLYFGSQQSAQETGRYAAFLQGMREFGYAEGKSFVIEARYADGKDERLPGLAAELVRSGVDVIVAAGTPANRAALKATTAIPIVMTVSVDPVADGLVASLARPGGNVTGLSTLSAELSQKHLELLLACLPKLSRIGVLTNSTNIGNMGQLKSVHAAAQKRGIVVLSADGRTPGEIERGIADMVRERVEAVIILGDAFFVQQRKQIAGLAMKHRLPTIALSREHPEAGGLMSYGSDIADNFRRSASYVDRILKGAKPGDLPIEQPAKFELVINLKTARALEVQFPPTMLFGADRVIE